MKERLKIIRDAFNLLLQQRSSAALDGKEGDNSIVERGDEELHALERAWEII